MGSRIIAQTSIDDANISEEDIIAFAKERISPEEMERGGRIDVLELTSFELKDCDEIVFEITGISLRNRYTSRDDIREIYNTLKGFDPYKDLRIYEEIDCTPEDILELVKFLKVCSERNLELENPPWGDMY